MSNAEHTYIPRGKLLGPLRNGAAFLMVDAPLAFGISFTRSGNAHQGAADLPPSPAVLSQWVLLLA
jgi:hypothetical protein